MNKNCSALYSENWMKSSHLTYVEICRANDTDNDMCFEW